jgi:hypothetical protein
MQKARNSLGAAVVNGKIYAIGGNAENGKVGTNEEYDPRTDTWRYKKSMPTARADFATAVYDNKIYCIDGSIGITHEHGQTLTGANEVYDPATDTWETKVPSPTPRENVQAEVVNGKIYVTGGIPNGTLTEVYDPVDDTWTTKAPMPIGGSAASAFVFDNKIYDLPQVYDPENDTWSKVSESSLDGVAALTAGVYAPERVYFVSYSATHVYDFETDSFTPGPVMPTKRDSIAVVVADDKIYAIGGFTLSQNSLAYYIETGEMYNQTFYATVEEYTPFGYGTVPPKIAVVSPEVGNYTSGTVSLAFTVNKPATWMGYSLDEQDNVTVTGNVTLTGLAVGLHNVTMYAKDEVGNIGASEMLIFNITEEPPEPFPVVSVAAASVVSAGVIAVGLVLYFRKRKDGKGS